MNKVMILGPTGKLGYAVSTYLKSKGIDTHSLGREEFDITAEPIEHIVRFIGETDVIINCAGLEDSSQSSAKIEDILQVNSVFPHNLARICRRERIRLIHMSTHHAYSGDTGGYCEDHTFDATDVYGLSKAAGEPSDCMVLRSATIGEENGRQRSVLEWLRTQSGKKVKGYTNYRWNGLTTLQMAQGLETILMGQLYKKGVFHVHSGETINKFELLQMLNETYGLGVEVVATEAAEPQDRTLASNFDLVSDLEIKPIGEQIQEMKEFFSGN